MTPVTDEASQCRTGVSGIGPVLLIGESGMLGRVWRGMLQDEPTLATLDNACPTEQAFDMTDPQAVSQWITDRYRTVVNCAAYTNVDGAETHSPLAHRINAGAVSHLAQRCAQVGAKLVHYSTDYVFDGQSSTPYRPDHRRDPVNAYGYSKAAGEEAIEAAGCRYLIVRTSWLYAPWAKNFVKTIASLAKNGKTLRVVNDQRGRPTRVDTLAANTLALLNKNAEGVYHVTDGGQCTWYELACEIVRLLGDPCGVEPCGSDEYPLPAPRPAFSVLDLAKAERLIGPMPHWKDNLAVVVAELQRGSS